MDAAGIDRALMRISHEILEKNNGTEDLLLVGIRRRGIPIAECIADNIERIEGVKVGCESVDISFYRDDLSQLAEQPQLKGDIDLAVEGRTVILVDDVIYTGRTVRAAIEAVFSCGRPKAIQLAVLIDRGHRQLPIRPDFVGKNIPTSHTELVEVKLPDYDSDKGVFLMDMTSD